MSNRTQHPHARKSVTPDPKVQRHVTPKPVVVLHLRALHLATVKQAGGAK